MQFSSLIFVGTGGHVAAVDKRNGALVWQTKLKGSFITLLVEGDRVFAQTNGWLYCLHASNGQVLWINELPGLGYGLGSLAVQGNASDPALAAESAARARSSDSTGSTTSM